MTHGNLLSQISIVIAGFISGGIMFSWLIPAVFLKKDICEISADGNPGAGNVFMNCGVFWGSICLTLDILKGLIPMYFATISVNPKSVFFTLAMTAPVLGHATAPFNRFHGGKCIAVSFGVLIGCAKISLIGLVTLAAAYILLSTILKIDPIRKRSIIVFAIFGFVSAVLLIVKKQYFTALGCAAIAAVGVYRHICDKTHIRKENTEQWTEKQKEL